MRSRVPRTVDLSAAYPSGFSLLMQAMPPRPRSNNFRSPRRETCICIFTHLMVSSLAHAVGKTAKPEEGGGRITGHPTRVRQMVDVLQQRDVSARKRWAGSGGF